MSIHTPPNSLPLCCDLELGGFALIHFTWVILETPLQYMIGFVLLCKSRLSSPVKEIPQRGFHYTVDVRCVDVVDVFT